MMTKLDLGINGTCADTALIFHVRGLCDIIVIIMPNYVKLQTVK